MKANVLFFVMYNVFTYLPAAAARAVGRRVVRCTAVYCTGMYMDNMDKRPPVPTKQDMMGAAPRASRARGFSK